MNEKIEIKGATFELYDDYASVRLNQKHISEEVFVPSEINGIPVKKFYYSPYDTTQKIKYIRIPASLEEFVCNYPAKQSIRLEIDENNQSYITDGKALYTKDRAELIRFFAVDDEEYTIAAGCKRIGKGAFEGSMKLKRVIFPDGMELICAEAFASCEALIELELPNGLLKIERDAFKNCRNIEKLTLPPTLECVEIRAFTDCRNALTVHLPDALTEISHEAFSDSWTLDVSVENKNFISSDGFILSPDGKKVRFLAKPPEADGLVIIPEYVTEICPEAFYENKKIKKVVLPKGLHTIGASAFASVSYLTDINLENVRVIGDCAFTDCVSLKKIRLNCDKIGTYTFTNCFRLIEAEVDCERTGQSMFCKCSSLERVVLKHTKIISTATFYETENLKEIVFPPELEKIEISGLGLIGTRYLTIPKTVKHLGREFAECVREIHIYDNIETDISVGNDISRSCYTLFVHSAETDEIKYAVHIIGSSAGSGSYNEEHNMIVGMFTGGVSFDFRRFDDYYDKISDYHNAEGKIRAGLLRLRYGVDLDDDRRRKYEDKLNELCFEFVNDQLRDKSFDKITDPELYTYMSLENLLSLIRLTSENHLPELTAVLMQKCSEKRTEK